jgi:hypothetical protein
MFELLDNALKALSAYPPVAALGGLVVIGAGIWLMVRGERDRKSNGAQAALPAWAMYGPVHDVMQSIHHISEQSRVANKIAERNETLLKELLKEQSRSRQILELIRNESRLR